MLKKITNYFDRQQFQFLLILLVAGTMAMSLFTIYNNSFRAAPIFIFMLVLGIGSTLLWGFLRGGVVALVIVTLWIFTKQSIGIWSETRTFANLAELVGLIALFGLSAWFGSLLHILLEKYNDFTQRIEQFNLEDRKIGLIKRFVGELRLKEEEERSQRYRRPFSLALIHCLPVEDVNWNSGEMTALMRTIANTIKSTSRRIDIPFLADPSTIALLLPETDAQGALKVIHNLMDRMNQARFLHPERGMMPLESRTQIRYGFASYQSTETAPSNTMEAAQRALTVNLEKNNNRDFQNATVDWEDIGKSLPEAAQTPESAGQP